MPRAVAIGNFDGVHLGHQAVLAAVREEAQRRGYEPAVLTFAPHPLSVLGRPVPAVLTSLPRKIELIARIFPTTIIERFDRAFAGQSPSEFASNVLARHDVRFVSVGHNFRFGRGRAGDFSDLVRLGERHGFETRSHGLEGDENGPWSSTRIRQALARGDLADVQRNLGRPHAVSGVVVQGDQRGRTIGFPTCNIVETEEALPPNGVYAVLVDEETRLHELSPGGPCLVQALGKGVANVGVRPTVASGGTTTVEVHLFNLTETSTASACVSIS